MKQYLDLIKDVLLHGVEKSDPQGVGNVAVCGRQLRFDLTEGFPLITTRSLERSWKALVYELFWFLSGSSDVSDLNRNGVHFWDQWATSEICEKLGLPTGNLGPIYGPQWRAFRSGDGKSIDQVQRLIAGLRSNPDSRRHIVTAWNPGDVDKVFVAPCHCFFQFFHADGDLSLHLFQRSVDVPIGLPFNIAEYALLLHMVAQITGLRAKEFIHSLSDTHIYLDQIPGVSEQLTRDPHPLPRLRLNPDIHELSDFRFEDIELIDYCPHPAIKIPVAL